MNQYLKIIIECLKDGYSNTEIAKKLGFSLSCVEKNKNLLKDLFNAKTDAQLVYKYYEHKR